MGVDSFNEFVKKWMTPATVLTAFGAVVWGVQLNIISVKNSETGAANAQAIRVLTERVTSDEFELQRTALLLEQTSANLAALKRASEAHNAEAEKWKRQIIRNQDELNRLNNDPLAPIP